MRFLKTLIFAFALGVSSVASAAQPLSGMYIGGFGGMNFVKAKVEENRLPLVFKSESYNETAMHAGLQAGVRIMSVRVAAEATINTKAELEKYDMEGYNYGLQLYYDVPFKSALRPYVNVGLNKYNTKLKTDPGLSTTKKKWAFNFGGGLTLALTQRTNLDLGYRFVDLGTIDLTETDGDNIPVKIKQHLVYMGFRYVF